MSRLRCFELYVDCGRAWKRSRFTMAPTCREFYGGNSVTSKFCLLRSGMTFVLQVSSHYCHSIEKWSPTSESFNVDRSLRLCHAKYLGVSEVGEKAGAETSRQTLSHPTGFIFQYLQAVEFNYSLSKISISMYNRIINSSDAVDSLH